MEENMIHNFTKRIDEEGKSTIFKHPEYSALKGGWGGTVLEMGNPPP